ncbi:MAG TPA: hypothetical protein VGE37_05300 [Archangium sp.]
MLREAAAREAGGARADVRGTEGWQDLRWGMSSAEVADEMRSLPRVPRAFDEDASAARFSVATWRTAIAKHDATVHCFVLQEQLARVLVELPKISREFLFDLLTSKYGEPVTKDAWSALWLTPESVIFAKYGVDGGQVFYTSKLLETDLKSALEIWTSRRAKGL